MEYINIGKAGKFAVPASFPQAACQEETMPLPVALQLYSVRNQMQSDFEGTLKAVSEMGYAGVEFAGLFSKSADEVKRLLEKYSLIPVSAHVALADMLADPDGTMKTYKKIGCPYIAIPYLPEERRPQNCDFAKTLADMRAMCEKAKEHGLVMLYHNHDFEFDKINGEYYLDTIYKTIPADLLQTEIDTCWVNVAGENPAAYVRKYKGRAPVVHLKDFSVSGTLSKGNLYELIGDGKKPAENPAFSFQPFGHGKQNCPEILQAALDAGARWVVVEQDKPAEGQTEIGSVKLSREYLRSQKW